MVVMLTNPAGETGEPPLAKMPAPSKAASVMIGVAPTPGPRWPYDHKPSTTSAPDATVVSEELNDVFPTPVVFVVNASG